MIPYGRQDISEEDIQAVVDVLRSDYLTQGPVVPAFEQAVAGRCGARFAVAVNSATSALHLACMALNVQPGDIVWTSPITFVASANCARYCGASVDFVDIDPRTYNMSVARLAEKLELAKRNDRLPKVVIPVHLAGQSCDMAGIHDLSTRYGFRVIEDASHGIGGRYLDQPVGNCRYSDITVFSFHPVKIITTGEGGMALTNDPALAHRLALLRSHGITRTPSEMTQVSDGSWFYQQTELGYNYRMTDIQAALGLSQLARLESFVEARHLIAKRYDELLANLWVRTPWQDPQSYSSFHLYIVRVKLEEIKITRRDVFEQMKSHGILVNLHYIPVYRHPYYTKLDLKSEYFPEAEAYYAEAITLPIYPLLTETQQQFIVESMTTPTGHQTLF